MPQRYNGCIVYEGPSVLDNNPIVLLLTGLFTPSHNHKTGPQIQSYILRSDIPPTEAIQSGDDASVCGDCPLRSKICYVYMSPVNNVWHKYKSGGYPGLTPSTLQRIKHHRHSLRLGAYGDPVAVPLESWLPLLESAASHTGYTHAFRYCDQQWKNYLMASVEKSEDVEVANRMGWRTFRVKTPEQDLQSSEIMCRHSTDESIQCVDCKLCNGNKGKNIAVDVHGLSWKPANFRKLIS